MTVAKPKQLRQTKSNHEDSRGAKGSAVRQAWSVICTPSSGILQASVTTRHSPVRLQITMVSINVPVMLIRP